MRRFYLTSGLLVTAWLALGAALPAAAQDVDRIDRIPGSGPPAGAGPRGPDGVKVVAPGALIFASFDRDANGRITLAEIEAGAATAFAAADRNGDGLITGFEQTDWAASVGSATDVIANAMTFDIDLDHSVTKAEFVTGLKRIAGQIQSSGDLTFADLLQPLNRTAERASPAPPKDFNLTPRAERRTGDGRYLSDAAD